MSVVGCVYNTGDSVCGRLERMLVVNQMPTSSAPHLSISCIQPHRSTRSTRGSAAAATRAATAETACTRRAPAPAAPRTSTPTSGRPPRTTEHRSDEDSTILTQCYSSTFNTARRNRRADFPDRRRWRHLANTKVQRRRPASA